MRERLKNIKSDKKNVAIKIEGHVHSLYNINSEMLKKDYEVITIDSHIGYRIYEKSLILLLATAVKKLFPESKFFVEHTIHTGLYCRVVSKKISILKMSMIKNIKSKMKELVDKDIPFEVIKGDLHKQKDKLKNAGLEEKSKLLDSINNKNLIKLKGEDIYELEHFNTVPSTGYLQTFDLLYYPPGLILRFPNEDNMDEVAYFNESKKLFRVHQEYEKWTDIINIKYVPSLNEKITKQKYKEMILISEKMHAKKIVEISESILKNIDRSRLILISGPSASGKTTFSKRLAIHLKAAGYNPLTIEMDNYFLPRDETPVKEDGTHDYENVDSIDISRFNEDLIKLFEGEKAEIPEYDFVSGKRKKGNVNSIGVNDPIIVEGIHALNPKLTQFIPNNIKYKVYVSALTPLNLDAYNRIKTTDVRLVRRIVRDAQFRGHSALDTLKLWQNVKAGEEKYIFPFQEKADIMFNSALPYELSVLKDFCLRFLIQVPENSKHYYKAKELTFMLKLFKSIDPYYTPKSSIIREFVGNSIFDY